MAKLGPTDGNLHALRQREAERGAYLDGLPADCEACNGTGEIYVPLGRITGDPRVDDWDEDTCPDCGGSGENKQEDEEQ